MYKQPLLTVHRATGFTLIELLIVIAILGILAAIILINLSAVRHSAYEARAQMEVRSFVSAMTRYYTNFGVYPPDEDRNIPSGLENYLAGDAWPDGPWPDSVYDWDHWIIDGEPVIQISIRFCPISGPLSECNFPVARWAENFNVNSAYFYCFEGACRSHPEEPRNYPGYCMNCGCKEMETCDFSD